METHNALIWIAADHDVGAVAPVLGEQMDNLVLGVVGILIFVDQKIVEALLIVEQQIVTGAESVSDHANHVFKIEPFGRGQRGLVETVDC